MSYLANCDLPGYNPDIHYAYLYNNDMGFGTLDEISEFMPLNIFVNFVCRMPEFGIERETELLESCIIIMIAKTDEASVGKMCLQLHSRFCKNKNTRELYLGLVKQVNVVSLILSGQVLIPS